MGLNTYAIPKEAQPDITVPTLYVSLHLDGVSSEDAERLLVRPVEDVLKSVENLKEMRSLSFEGGGGVILEFNASGFDSDSALQDVRAKMDQAKAELPAEADEPTVNEINLSLFPMLVVTISGSAAGAGVAVHCAQPA